MNALDQAIWDTRVKEAAESRKEGAVSNKNLAIIAADNEIKRLTDENAALIASADRLMNMRIELEKERNAMREQLDAIDKYLDIGTSDTSIHQNSVMHREVKALLGDEIKLKPSEDEAMNSALKASSTLVAKGRLDKGRED